MMPDLYESLGLTRNATQAEIKKAYRQFAKMHHPDINNGETGSSEMMKKINDAYSYLNNPQKREAYDSVLIQQEKEEKQKVADSEYFGDLATSQKDRENPNQEMWDQIMAEIAALKAKRADPAYQEQMKAEEQNSKNMETNQNALMGGLALVFAGGILFFIFWPLGIGAGVIGIIFTIVAILKDMTTRR